MKIYYGYSVKHANGNDEDRSEYECDSVTMTNQYGEDLFNITSRIRCSSDEGVGGDLYFKAKVGVDSSTESIIDAVGIESAFYNSSVAYGIPTIEYVEVAGIKSPEDLVTQGDTELTITGTNFGPKES